LKWSSCSPRSRGRGGRRCVRRPTPATRPLIAARQAGNPRDAPPRLNVDLRRSCADPIRDVMIPDIALRPVRMTRWLPRGSAWPELPARSPGNVFWFRPWTRPGLCGDRGGRGRRRAGPATWPFRCAVAARAAPTGPISRILTVRGGCASRELRPGRLGSARLRCSPAPARGRWTRATLARPHRLGNVRRPAAAPCRDALVVLRERYPVPGRCLPERPAGPEECLRPLRG
jgi:hypothetical protein